jgi:hypothetical protein
MDCALRGSARLTYASNFLTYPLPNRPLIPYIPRLAKNFDSFTHVIVRA